MIATSPRSGPVAAAGKVSASKAGPSSFRGGQRSDKAPQEPKIIHQTFFKSVGPRTYAAQVKELANGNHMLAITEGRRDETTGELRKHSLFVFAEDFPAFFKMLKDSSEFIAAHPLPEEVKKKREQYWAKKRAEAKEGANRPTSMAPSANRDSKGSPR
jgi:Protein of unknown function (DUF3276)